MIRCHRHTESGSSPPPVAIVLAAALLVLILGGRNNANAQIDYTGYFTGNNVLSPHKWSKPGNWRLDTVPPNDGTVILNFGDFSTSYAANPWWTEIDLDFHAEGLEWEGRWFHELRDGGGTLTVGPSGIRVTTEDGSADVIQHPDIDVEITDVTIRLSADSRFRTEHYEPDHYRDGSLEFSATGAVERIFTEGFDLTLSPDDDMPISFFNYEIHGGGALIIDGHPSEQVAFSGFTTRNFHRGGTILRSGILRRATPFDPLGQDGKPLIFESSQSQGKLAIGAGEPLFPTTLNHGDHPIILSSAPTAPTVGTIDVWDQWGYVIDSPISGSGALVKTGLGDLTLTGANSFTDPIHVTAGRLLLNGTNAVPATQLVIDGPAGTAVRILQSESISDNAIVTINAPAKFNLLNKTQTIGSLSGDGPLFMGLGTTPAELIVKAGNYSGTISENGKLKKIGSGTLTLMGANTYTGGTRVEEGMLLVGNTIGSATGVGAVIINSGAALGGTGSVAGGVFVAPGGTVAPGASLGVLTAGGVTFRSGSTFLVELAGSGGVAGIDFDKLEVDIAELDGDLVVDLTGGFVPDPADTFTILRTSNLFGTLSLFGSFDNVLNGQRLDTSDGTGSFVVHYGLDSMFDPRQVRLTDFLLAALPGDYNQDGSVDAADYVVWRKTDGTQEGYQTWRANFGRTAGSGAALPSAESLSAAVPEPATWTLLIVAASSVHLRRRQWSRAAQNASTRHMPINHPLS